VAEAVLLTEKEVRQQYARVAHSTLWRWIKDRRFPTPVAVGGRVFWKTTDLEAWLSELSTAPAYPKDPA
jgi:predicted DNA-binding transcriptional regulator AlpA